jgi:hypothetical protein
MRIRRGSGGREGDLLQRAAELRKSVDWLLPELGDDAPHDRFDRLRGELEEVRTAKDDSARLAKLGGGWREPLTRALAGLLRFYLDPETPVVTTARFPAGEISFAVLNGAPSEAHIAVQFGDDRRRLLLGYLTWARKGLHFFATEDRLYCTGKNPSPPAAFRTSRVDDLPYRVQPGARAGTYLCAHLRAGERRPFVGVEWIGAGMTVRVCDRCARDDRQILGSLSSGLAVPDPEGAFAVDASLNVQCDEPSTCTHGRLPEIPRGLRRDYLFGRSSDSALLRGYLEVAHERLDRSSNPLFVAGGICYRSDWQGFLTALSPTPEERKALENILPTVTGYFEIEEATASRALERLWPGHADAIVAAIVPDADRARTLVREAKANPGRVSDLLRRAAREAHEQALLNSLPRYNELSSEARLADGVARVHRTQGGPEAVKWLLQELPREGKVRGIAFGLLVALGQDAQHRWQFTDTEQKFGASLAPAADALLKAPPESYHAALEGLLGRAGVAHWGELDGGASA